MPDAPDCVSFNADDLAKAFREMESFVDVTPEDFQEICRRAAAPAPAPNNLARGRRYPEYWW